MRPIAPVLRPLHDAPRALPAPRTLADARAGRLLRGPTPPPYAAAVAALTPVPADVEMSVRLCADGTQITVMRRTVADAGGRRTVGIEAVIR